MSGPISRSIFVQGFREGTTQEHLAQLFQPYGVVTHSAICDDPGSGKGAYLVFESATVADTVTQKTDWELNGKDLTVKRVPGTSLPEVKLLFPTLFDNTPATSTSGDTTIDTLVNLFDTMNTSEKTNVLRRLTMLAGGGDGVPHGLGLTTDTGSASGGRALTSTQNPLRVSYGDSTVVPEGTTQVVIENSSGPPRRLRLFSGKVPVPNGEVEYSTWRLHAKQMLDGTGKDLEKRKCLLESLCRPALELVSHLGNGSARDIFQELERLFGDVHDAHAIMAKLHDTLQVSKEAPSTFLQRVYLVVREAVECGAVTASQLMTTTVRQFNFGLIDETLSQRLKLDDLEVVPPTFSVLMQKVRREEARLAERQARRAKVAKVHQAHCTADTDTTDNKVKGKPDLEKVVAKQQQELADLKAQVSAHNVKHKSTHTGKKQSEFKGFCFNCGLDGHKNNSCENSANPEKVCERLKTRKFTHRRGNKSKQTGNE